MKIAAFIQFKGISDPACNGPARISKRYPPHALKALLSWIRFEVSVGRYNLGDVWIGKAR